MSRPQPLGVAIGLALLPALALLFFGLPGRAQEPPGGNDRADNQAPAAPAVPKLDDTKAAPKSFIQFRDGTLWDWNSAALTRINFNLRGDTDELTVLFDAAKLVAKARRVDFLSELAYSSEASAGDVLITMASGKQYRLKNAWIDSIYRPIEGQEFIGWKTVPGADPRRPREFYAFAGKIKALVFSAAAPMKDPKTSQLFPSDYKFNPYTGDKLVPASGS